MTTEPATGSTDFQRRLAIGQELARPAERSRRHRIRGWVWNTVGTFIALSVAFWLLSGLSADDRLAVLGAAIVLGLIGAVLGPVFARLAVVLGWFGVGLLAVLAQAAIVYIALLVAPGIDVANFWTAFLASWIVAIVGQLLGWIAGSDEENAFLAEVLRRGETLVMRGDAARQICE